MRRLLMMFLLLCLLPLAALAEPPSLRGEAQQEPESPARYRP